VQYMTTVVDKGSEPTVNVLGLVGPKRRSSWLNSGCLSIKKERSQKYTRAGGKPTKARTLRNTNRGQSPDSSPISGTHSYIGTGSP